MNLVTKRMIESGCRSRGELIRRLEFWANRYGFSRSDREGDDFVYMRGSQLSALYTFDIRKLPTEVTVTLVRDGAGLCYCIMECGSWMQVISDLPRQPKASSQHVKPA